MTGSRRVVLVAAAVLLFASGCSGGDDDGGPTGGDGKADDPAAGDAASACPGSNSAEVYAAGTADVAEVEDASQSWYEDTVGVPAGAMEVVDVVAVSIGDGVSYTVYVADHELPREDAPPILEAPPGKVLVTMNLSAFSSSGDGPQPEPLATGDVVPAGSGPDTFDTGDQVLGVTIDNGGEVHNWQPAPSGSATVLHVDEGRICLDVDYHDIVFGTEDGSMTEGITFVAMLDAPIEDLWGFGF